MSEITRSPLCWPDNIARTAPHKRAVPQFYDKTVAFTVAFIKEEINRLNGRRYDYRDPDLIISTNLRVRQDGMPASGQAQPADTGAAVYFNLRFRRGDKWLDRPCVMTCDKWIRVEWNLYAIGKDIQAQRARERWGCGTIEQAFRGYLAIPERCGGPSWWEILEIKPDAPKEIIEARFKSLAKRWHPDNPEGDAARYQTIREAFEQATQQFQ